MFSFFGRSRSAPCAPAAPAPPAPAPPPLPPPRPPPPRWGPPLLPPRWGRSAIFGGLLGLVGESRWGGVGWRGELVRWVFSLVVCFGVEEGRVGRWVGGRAAQPTGKLRKGFLEVELASSTTTAGSLSSWAGWRLEEQRSDDDPTQTICGAGFAWQGTRCCCCQSLWVHSLWGPVRRRPKLPPCQGGRRILARAM